jgi:hypothetical protein
MAVNWDNLRDYAQSGSLNESETFPSGTSAEERYRLVREARLRHQTQAEAVRQARLTYRQARVQNTANVIRTRVIRWLEHQNGRARNMPSPGGIGILLVILIFLLMVIIPVNSSGDTRLGLIWKVILRQKTVQSQDQSLQVGQTEPGTGGSTGTSCPPGQTYLKGAGCVTALSANTPSPSIVPLSSQPASNMTIWTGAGPIDIPLTG